MTRHRIAAFSLVALTFAPLVARADDKQDALDKVARYMSMAYTDREPGDKRDIKELRENSAACLEQIDVALAAGATLETEVRIPEQHIPGVENVRHYRVSEYGTWDDVAPLKEAKELCAELAQIPGAVELKWDLGTAKIPLHRGKQALEEAQATERESSDAVTEADVMQGAAKPCHDAIAKARAAGVPEDKKIKVNDMGELTMAEADAQICTALEETAAAIYALEEQKFEARLAPYRAALKDERINVFVNAHMYNDTIYGKGGKVLETPAALAKSKVWMIVLTWTDDLGFTNWTVRKYTWKKNKLGSVKERSGCCDWPKSKHFR